MRARHDDGGGWLGLGDLARNETTEARGGQRTGVGARAMCYGAPREATRWCAAQNYVAARSDYKRVIRSPARACLYFVVTHSKTQRARARSQKSRIVKWRAVYYLQACGAAHARETRGRINI